MTSLLASLRGRQDDWLRQRLGVNATFAPNGYLTHVDHNLYLPLGQLARAEIGHGSGKEFGTEERPGKLAAPWSSSALAVNVFEYWRDRDRAPLVSALGCDDIVNLNLEQRLGTGFSNRAPANLDVVLTTRTHDIGIESKFCEPYGAASHGDFRPSYLRRGPDKRWLNLSRLRDLAHAIAERTVTFSRLDAPQLIKHALALQRRSNATKRPFQLMLLWYCPPGDHAATRQLHDEISILAGAMRADSVVFRAETYQAFFQKLRQSAAGHADYIDYLAARYFGT